MQTKTQEQEAEEHNLEPQTVRGKCAVTYWLSRSQSSGLPPMAISGVGIPPNRFPLVPRLSYRIKYTVALPCSLARSMSLSFIQESARPHPVLEKDDSLGWNASVRCSRRWIHPRFNMPRLLCTSICPSAYLCFELRYHLYTDSQLLVRIFCTRRALSSTI